jgi:hypothetical protein
VAICILSNGNLIDPRQTDVIHARRLIADSVHDGASLDLTSAAFIFTATYALATVIIIESVHLSFGIDFISRSSGQSTGSGSSDELAAGQAQIS